MPSANRLKSKRKLKKNLFLRIYWLYYTLVHGLVDIAVCGWPLGALEVVGVLAEVGVEGKTGAVHQVEQVAVVGPEVQQGQGLRLRERLG